MIAIFKREFKSYFHTFLGPLIIGAILFVMFLYFIFNNILGQSAMLNNALYATCILCLTFALPVLCMKVFAEERKTKTDQLILTAPVTVGKIVIGKFLALAAVFAIPVAVSAVLPLVMSLFGTVQFAWSYTCILAFALYGLMSIAICMFISSVTENQIISAVISVFVLLMGCILGGAYDSIGITWLQSFLKSTYDFGTRLENMMNGNLDWTSIVYFVSVTALFLFLTTQAIQKRRFAFSKKNFGVGAYSAGMVAVMVAVVVFANLVSTQIPDKFKEIDVTSSGLFSITKDSKEVAAGVTDNITMYFLAKEADDDSNKDSSVERILNDYVSENSKITLKYVDPVVNPQFASKYTDDQLAYNSVIIEDTDSSKSQAIPYSDMVVTSYDSYGYSSSVSAYDIEGQITSALQLVSLDTDQMMNAYTVTGHNETAFSTTFSNEFSKYNLNTQDISLSTVQNIPDDCSLLVINAPTVDFTEDEASKVITYLENGGNILINTIYAETEEMTNFNTILSYYGVEKESGMVIETDSNMYYYSTQAAVPIYLFPTLCDSDITEGISSTDSGHVFIPYAQALTYDADDTTVTVTPLLQTSAEAFIKKDLSSSDMTQSADDPSGQYTVGLEAVKGSGDTSSTAVIYSCADAFGDDADQMVNGNNCKLFGNTLNAMVDLDVDFVTIPSKPVNSNLVVTSGNVILIVTLCMVSVLAVWGFGLAVWLIRRKR